MEAAIGSNNTNIRKEFLMDRTEAIFEGAKRTVEGKYLYDETCIKLKELGTDLSTEKKKKAYEFEAADTAYYMFVVEQAYKQGLIDGVTKCVQMGLAPVAVCTT